MRRTARVKPGSGCLEIQRRELPTKNVCELEAPSNQHRVLHLRTEYWPYEVWEGPAERGGPGTAGAATA